jgi:hypothetical protein
VTRQAGRWARKIILGPILSIPVERAIDALTDKASGPDVRYVTASEIADAKFVFRGQPRPRLLYAIHPADPQRYYPVAEFHRFTFEHKFAEVVRLLVALGATKITVEHVHGWSHEFAAKVAAPLTEQQATVNLTAEGKASSKSQILFDASFDGARSPSVPENLSWYPQEPLWAALAAGRIDGGMNEFTLELRYDNDFGINADLAAKAEKNKIDIGGKFESHMNTVWKISGKFRTNKAASRT